MKRLPIATTALSLLAAPLSGAFAQGRHDRHDDHHPDRMMMHDNGRHHGWYKGGRIERHDWDRGVYIRDWRHYHLSAPPRGYEWRRVDDSYVLAAAATGLIAGLVIASH